MSSILLTRKCLQKNCLTIVLRFYGFRVRSINITSKALTTFAGTNTDISTYSTSTTPPVGSDHNRGYGMRFKSTEIGTSPKFDFNPDGELIIASTKKELMKVNSDGILVRLAGGIGSGGYQNNVPAIYGNMDYPYDIAIDGNGDIYWTEKDVHLIKKLEVSTGLMKIVAGNYTISGYSPDGTLAVNSNLNSPQ